MLPGDAQVSRACQNIRGFALRTPLLRLNAELPGANVFLKLENLQPWGSFKIRAAANALKSMDPEQLAPGVLSASSGNFGLGIAVAAQRMGISATLVVPEGAARTKLDALGELGARVIRLPFDEWWTVLTSRRCPGEHGTFVHPVAEHAVLAGNATIGAEILEDLPDCDAVLAPFGGGGLICGIGSVMKRLKPAVRMIAVESEASRPAAAALGQGRPVQVAHRQGFVDGMGSTTVLAEMWPLLRQIADSAACVTFTQIVAAIRLLAGRHHVVAEAAGAVSLAAALAGQGGKGNIVCIISGGNMDAAKLAAILNGQNPF
ncbi:MAG TPA: pyridoxal-phosphate dependent enzyme [Steroidobacteraceae bacterium]|jgi:threonine dehydratase|nr:pyridoxal-phosphate dependent enzyme [Steroidobacteraceae bacterium]